MYYDRYCVFLEMLTFDISQRYKWCKYWTRNQRRLVVLVRPNFLVLLRDFEELVSFVAVVGRTENELEF